MRGLLRSLLQSRSRRWWLALGCFMSACWLSLFTPGTVLLATQAGSPGLPRERTAIAQAKQPIAPVSLSAQQLPPLKSHPLPLLLAQWQDASSQEDYFDQIVPSEVGMLVWSNFPITVYIQPPADPASQAPPASPAIGWYKAVQAAMQEWNRYLPLQIVEQADAADITIWRSQPPLRLFSPEAQSGSSSLERVRSAETRYEFFVSQVENQPSQLVHRCTIVLTPQQTPKYLQAAARHELGHALGIWGHSPQQADALYFSQVREPAPISVRDINTLKRIYQQPTRLGWPLANPS